MTDSSNTNDFVGYGRINYMANGGNDTGTLNPALTIETNNGVFIAFKTIGLAQITDGSSNTALFSERLLGDGSPNKASVPGDWFLITPPSSARADVYTTCLAPNPNGVLGDANQNSYGGRTWITGYYTATRYNHLIPPNGISSPQRHWCDLDRDDYQRGATASTASSRHPGGVNVLFADGSVHFVKSSISNVVWWALGSKNGGEVVSSDAY